MVFTLAEETYRRTYHSRCCTTATWFCVGIYILIFLVPFLLSNVQHNLWRSNYEILDKGKTSFEGNAVLLANNQGFCLFKGFKPTLETNQFSSITMTSTVDSLNSNTIDLNLRVLTSNPSFSGELYLFVNYDSNSTSLKYLGFTDVVMIPLEVTPTLNSVTAIGYYFLDQSEQYSISKGVTGKYSQDAFEQYKTSLNVQDVYSRRLSNPFKISTSLSKYKESASFTGFEVKIRLYRTFKNINISPSVASVLRVSWPVYLGLFMPIAALLRTIMRQIFKFRLFQVTSSLRLYDGHSNNAF